MSFGKDQGHLANIPAHGGNFIQRAKTAARRPSRSGGGGMPYWKDSFRPSLITPTLLRLIPGSYKQLVTHDGETAVEEEFPYVMCREHMSKLSGNLRGGLCSGGPLFANKKKAQACHGCDYYWEDVRERKAKRARGDKTKGPNRMSCRDQYVYTAFDYAPYWKMPDVDKNGQLRMNQNTNQPYTHWETGNLNDPKFQGKEWKQGHLLSWSMGQTYQDVLVMQAKVIGTHCTTCGNMSCISTVMKVCGNQQCGEFIYDPSNSTLTDEQRDQIDNYPYQCPRCQQTHYVDEVIQCTVCTPANHTPKRASIFDVDMQVQAVGNPGSQTFLQVLSTSPPRPIQVDAKVLETIKPLDLLRKFAPTPLEVQRKIWNIQVANAPLVGQPAGQPPVAPTMPTAPGMQQQMAPQQPVAPAPTGVVPAPVTQQVMPPQPMQFAPQPQAAVPAAPPQPQPVAQTPTVPYGTPGTGQTG